MNNTKLIVTDIEIGTIDFNNQKYISLTDMLKAKEGDFFIDSWLRNRNTVEYIGIWESINNPENFNYVEFDVIRSKAGLNSFKISVKEWVEKTNAIGLTAKSGRYGGTFAHPDIAFEFGTWISPAFKFYLIKEYQRLKEAESNSQNLEWNMRRLLSKAHYTIQTDAVKAYRIPNEKIPEDKEWIAYAEEGDVLNIAIFGFTAKQWKEANPEFAQKKLNARDFASIHELAVLSSLEGINAEMIKSNMPLQYRITRLRQIAHEQLHSLNKVDMEKSYKRTIEGGFQNKIEKPAKGAAGFPTSTRS